VDQPEPIARGGGEGIADGREEACIPERRQSGGCTQRDVRGTPWLVRSAAAV
jgi:hypothetical protein